MKGVARTLDLPAPVWLLSLGQGLGLTAAVVSVNVSALAGAALCGDRPALATLPYGLQFAAALVAGPLGSALMGRIGRGPVFHAAALSGVLAGAVGALAIVQASFWLLAASHALLGIFLASVNLFRFASLDLVPGEKRPSAMSLVLFGGVFAAVLGPYLAREAPGLIGASLFAASYVAIGACALVVSALLLFVRMPRPETAPAATGEEPPSLAALARTPPYVLAVAAGALGYGLMNLLMIAASLEMREVGHDFDHVSYAIQWHVFWMFFPSFFAGWLIGRIGIYRFLGLGVALQAAAGAVALVGDGFWPFTASLILLGLAWNALYVGGSHLVGASVDGHGRFRAQGANEFFVALAATAGALLAGAGLALFGWGALNVLAIAVAAGLGVAVLAVARGAAAAGATRHEAPTSSSVRPSGRPA